MGEGEGVLKLIKVTDEEGMQTKCFHFLNSYVGLRGAVSPEVSHPKWNCFKRAVAASALSTDLMKLTLAANYGHGAQLTGERVSLRRECLEAFLNRQGEEYYEEIGEEICLDRGGAPGSMDPGATHALMSDFLNAPSIRRRGDYVARLI